MKRGPLVEMAIKL